MIEIMVRECEKKERVPPICQSIEIAGVKHASNKCLAKVIYDESVAVFVHISIHLGGLPHCIYLIFKTRSYHHTSKLLCHLDISIALVMVAIVAPTLYPKRTNRTRISSLQHCLHSKMLDSIVFEACTTTLSPFKKALLDRLWLVASELKEQTALQILPETIVEVTDMWRPRRAWSPG